MCSVKNNGDNETYTYISIPLPVVQQSETSQNHNQHEQNVYVEQNVILKTLANGTTYVIDTNHFLNSHSQLQSHDGRQQPNFEKESAKTGVLRKAGRPRKTERDKISARTTESAPMKTYSCDVCSHSFNLQSNLVLHKSTHNTNDSKCPECGKTFARLASLRAHLALHMKEEIVSCDKCDMEFETELELKNHAKKHIGKSTENVCRFCRMEFTDCAEYKKHMSQHNKLRTVISATRPYKKQRRTDKVLKHQCKVCKKAFQKLSQIERHMRIHSGEKPYVCTVCGKGFTQKCSLQIHMVRHTGAKPYKCTLCPATCSQRGNLRAHVLKTHCVSASNENVFRCTKCSCVFKKLGTLNSHITKHHPEQTIISGDVETVMTQLRELEKQVGVDKDILQQAISNSGLTENSIAAGTAADIHSTFVTLADTNLEGNIKRYVVRQRKVGDIRWHMCTFCVKEFKKPSDLVRHLRVHTRERPFKCKQCFRTFAVKSTLTTHIKTHIGTKEYTCIVCSKAFTTLRTLNVHMRSHNAYKPYGCTVCQKFYQTPSMLKVHLQTHTYVEETTVDEMINVEANPNDVEMQQPVIVTTKGLMSVGIPLNKRPVVEYLSNNRPHKCTKCSAAYRKMSHLKNHLVIHSGVKKYRCHVCSKRFNTQSILKSHLRIHADNNKQYACTQCKKNLVSNASLKRHMISHSALTPFLCPYCYKCFKTVVLCRKHIKSHQNDVNLAAVNQLTNATESDDVRTDEMSSSVLHHYQPDLMDTISGESFGMTVHGGSQEPLVHNGATLEENILMPTDRHDLSHGMTTVEQNNIQQIEDTINDQLFMDNLSADDLMGSTKNISMPCTTEELVNTLQGGDDLEKSTDKNTSLQLDYPTIYVGLQQNDCQFLDTTNFDNNLLKFQHDPMLLDDVVDPLQNNSNILPNLSTDMHQQLILMPQDIVDAPMGLQTEAPQYALDPSLTLIPSRSSAAGRNTVSFDFSSQENASPLLCTICKTTFKSTAALKSHQCFNISVTSINDIKNGIVAGGIVPTEKNVSGEWLDQELMLNKCDEQDAASVTNKNGKQQCPYCHKCFKKPSDLQRHIRTHTGERPFVCHECGKGFSLKSTLESHSKLHLGRKDVVCPVCDHLFTTKGSLNVHMRLHTGSKPYKCYFCDMHFRTTGHRKSHVLTHFREANKTGKMPKDTVPRQSKLKTLMASVENIEMCLNNEPEVLADQSMETQVQIDPLLLEQIHSNNFLLDENMADISSTLLQFDLVTKEDLGVSGAKNITTTIPLISLLEDKEPNALVEEGFQCDICNKAFKKKAVLQRHRKIHYPERAFKCDECSKCFSQQITYDLHIKMHAGERPFQCSYCANSFCSKGNLKTHLRRIHGIVYTDIPSLTN